MTNWRLNLILYFSNRLVTFTVICWFNHFLLSWSLLMGKVRKVDLSHIANSWLVTISLRGIQKFFRLLTTLFNTTTFAKLRRRSLTRGEKGGQDFEQSPLTGIVEAQIFLMHIVYITGNPWVCEAPVWLRGWSCWYISNTITKERCFSGHTTH